MSELAKDLRVLIINASPRKKSHTAPFCEKAAEGVRSVGGTPVLYNMAGKRFEPCQESCRAYHGKTGDCALDDDFAELANEWIRADGLIYAVPLFQMAMPAGLHAFCARIGATTWGRYNGVSPRFMKACGVITQGNTHYGGQEMVMNYLNSHYLVKNNIPVTSDMPESYIGVGARCADDGSIEREEAVLKSTFILGQRVAEMAALVRAGRKALEGELPPEYYYDKEQTFLRPRKQELK